MAKPKSKARGQKSKLKSEKNHGFWHTSKTSQRIEDQNIFINRAVCHNVMYGRVFAENLRHKSSKK